MKKIISLILITLTLLGCSVQAMALSEFEGKYSETITKSCESYYNVKINNFYYNISLFKNKKGKINNADVEACYSKCKGEVLKYPDKINFKGKILKVNSISVNDLHDDLGDGYITYKFPYKEVYIPKYATDVNYGFVNLSKVKKIYIPKSVISLSGFSDYKELKIIIDKDNKHIKMKNGAIYSKNGRELQTLVNAKKTYKISKGTKSVNVFKNLTIQKLIFPSDLTNLKDCKFEKCKNLKSIQFSKKTTKIGEFSFKNCNSINTVEFPKTLEKIDSYAFYKCVNLKKVVLNNVERAPKIEFASFRKIKNGVAFYVKNKNVADELLTQFKTKTTGVKNAKIYIGNTLEYSGIN